MNKATFTSASEDPLVAADSVKKDGKNSAVNCTILAVKVTDTMTETRRIPL